MVLYTAVGGLKATFITDFLHTTIALILILYFTLSVLTNEHVGGLGGLYDKIMATAAENYIPGNYQGSLLTMKSKQGIIWALLLKFGNLALVVMVSTCKWRFHMITIAYIDRILHFGKSPLLQKFRQPSPAIISLLWPYLAFHGGLGRS